MINVMKLNRNLLFSSNLVWNFDIVKWVNCEEPPCFQCLLKDADTCSSPRVQMAYFPKYIVIATSCQLTSLFEIFLAAYAHYFIF